MSLLRTKKHTLNVNVKGGLGNQLFQLSNAVCLAMEFKRQIRFLDESFKEDRKRDFLLNEFGILPNVEYQVSQNSTTGLKFQPTTDTDCCRDLISVHEETYHFTKHASELDKPNCIKIDGYWQSEKYFSSVKTSIKHFLHQGIGEQNKSFGSKTLMHIRQGDFTSEKGTQAEHGILGPSYYAAALELLGKNSEIDVVSDQPSKIQSYLGRKFLGMYNIQIMDPMCELDSLSLFRQYENIVIANSTFSWWGAFLSNPSIVIAPRAFFSEEGLRKRNICDLYPKGWILA